MSFGTPMFYKGAAVMVYVDYDCSSLLSGRLRWTITNCSRHPGSAQLYLKRRVQGENGRRVTEYLHRVIMNALPGFVVDHINGNGLDNWRENLRVVTQKENAKAERQNHRR